MKEWIFFFCSASLYYKKKTPNHTIRVFTDCQPENVSLSQKIEIHGVSFGL